jgi:hypothetical protein
VADGNPGDPSEHLGDRKRPRGYGGRDATLFVEKEHQEAEQADLRRDVEGARDADAPHAWIA